MDKYLEHNKNNYTYGRDFHPALVSKPVFSFAYIYLLIRSAVCDQIHRSNDIPSTAAGETQQKQV